MRNLHLEIGFTGETTKLTGCNLQAPAHSYPKRERKVNDREQIALRAGRTEKSHHLASRIFHKERANGTRIMSRASIVMRISLHYAK